MTEVKGPSLEIRLLGQPQFARCGAAFRFGASPRAVALLAYLLVHQDKPISRANLATLMWPDEDIEEGRAKLRRLLYQLARALPDEQFTLEITASTVRWRSSPAVFVDIHAFDDAVRRNDDAAAAVELYRGDFLDGHFDDWIFAERERYRAAFLDLCYDAALAARRERDMRAALRYAERILATDEWREDALRLVMAVRYEGGDRTGALDSFERFAARLRAEMKVEPMPETLVLRAAILQDAPLPDQVRVPAEETAGNLVAGGPFIGRADELATLEASWLRAAHGNGSTYFVSGVAGIGKSRLCSELAALAQAQGGRTLFGRTSNPEAFPYEAIVDALRRGIALIAEPRIDRKLLASLSALLPELRSIVPELPDVLPEDPARARALLLEAVVRIVEHLARSRPLLLVMEDLHWAGAATLEAVEAIARRIGGAAALMVLTYRSEAAAPDEPLRALRKRLQTERRAHALALGPLPARQIEELVSRCEPSAPQALGERISSLSEGNPLFAIHLLRSFSERGAVPDESSVTQGIGQTLLARIAALDEPARTAAETAAVIGRSFSSELVAQVLGWDESSVLDVLDRLLDAGIVREAGGPRLLYTFTHALIAAAAYESTAPEQRATRHRRVALIAARSGDVSLEPATVARHWRLAGEPERAAEWFLRAARAALGVYARREAIDYAYAVLETSANDAERFSAFSIAADARDATADVAKLQYDIERMSEVAQRLGEEERFTVLRCRRRLATHSLDHDAQRVIVAEMFAAAQRTGNKSWLWDATWASGTLYEQRGELSNALATHRQLIALAAEIGDFDKGLLVRQQMISTLARHGKIGEAEAELARVREMCEGRTVSLVQRLATLAYESNLASVLEDGERMERVANEMLALARECGDNIVEGRAWFILGHAAFFKYDFASLRKHYGRALELFEGMGAMDGVRVSLLNHAAMENRIGRSELALEFLARAKTYAAENSSFARAVQNTLASTLLSAGRTAEALVEARKAVEMARDSSENRFRHEALGSLAEALLDSGAVEEALPTLHEAIESARRIDSGRGLVIPLARLCVALLETGCGEEAAAMTGELEALFEKHPNVEQPTKICWSLARLFAARGDEGRRRHWIDRGLEIMDVALGRLTEAADREAYSGLPFNRALEAARVRA